MDGVFAYFFVFFFNRARTFRERRSDINAKLKLYKNEY